MKLCMLHVEAPIADNSILEDCFVRYSRDKNDPESPDSATMVSLCRVNPAVDYSLFLLGPTLYRMLRRKLVIGPSWIRWAMLKAFFQFTDFVERFPSGYGTSGYAAGALNTLYLCAFCGGHLRLPMGQMWNRTT